MSSAPFWDSLCVEHGGLSHAVVHEAGHAVVAVRLGLSFIDVSVNRDPREHRDPRGRLTGGGVRMAGPDELQQFVRGDPAQSLCFFLAGAISEKGAFGHCLDRSFHSDINLWRNCAGMLASQTDESLEEVLGRPFLEVTGLTRDIVATHGKAITDVARALGSTDALSLTHAEVVDIAAVGI
jgi:hypothetical protein